MRLLVIVLVLSIAGSGCARLPTVTIGGRLSLATSERGVSRSMALMLGCGLGLERGAQYDPERAVESSGGDDARPPTSGTHSLGADCPDAALCAWQDAVTEDTELTLQPMVEESAR